MSALLKISIIFLMMEFVGGCSGYPDIIYRDDYVINRESDSLTFAVIGDYGLAGNDEERVSNLVRSWNPDFLVAVGDNNYPQGEYKTLHQNIGQYYGDYIYNYDAPEKYRCNGSAFRDSVNRFFPVPGNHDENGPDHIQPYLDYFTLPGAEVYYTFSWGDIAFFALNSSSSSDLAAQELWIRYEIANSGKKFKIVYFHHPPYSPGYHGDSEYMQWDFGDMGVDLVISGHDHIYAHMVKDGSDKPHYFVNGLGGKSIYNLYPESLPDDVVLEDAYNEDFGAMKCTLIADSLSVEFYSVTDPSHPVDQFILVK